MEPGPAVSVVAHIDPMCPYAYQASKWLREVREQRHVELSWGFFSLESINREPDRKEPWEREWSYGFSQMRIGALLRREGQDQLDRWYAAVGEAFFEHERPTWDPDEHRALLDELGFGAGVLDAALADASTADEVREEHLRLVADHGAHGVPTLVFDDGTALFGPVVVPAPTGAAAGELWDLVVGWRAFPHLYELRRPKTDADVAHIGEQFAPYLRARAWRTIERPAR